MYFLHLYSQFLGLFCLPKEPQVALPFCVVFTLTLFSPSALNKKNLIYYIHQKSFFVSFPLCNSSYSQTVMLQYISFGPSDKKKLLVRKEKQEKQTTFFPCGFVIHIDDNKRRQFLCQKQSEKCEHNFAIFREFMLL